jgi:hypothetical protein
VVLIPDFLMETKKFEPQRTQRTRRRKREGGGEGKKKG